MVCLSWNLWVYTTLCFVCSEMFEFTLLYVLFVLKCLSLHFSMGCLSRNLWVYTTRWFVYSEIFEFTLLLWFVYPAMFDFTLLYGLFILNVWVYTTEGLFTLKSLCLNYSILCLHYFKFTLLYGLFILKSLSLHYSMVCSPWKVWVYTTLWFVYPEKFEFTLLLLLALVWKESPTWTTFFPRILNCLKIKIIF